MGKAVARCTTWAEWIWQELARSSCSPLSGEPCHQGGAAQAREADVEHVQITQGIQRGQLCTWLSRQVMQGS